MCVCVCVCVCVVCVCVCVYVCVCVCVCVFIHCAVFAQAASFGVGVMAQHCSKDFSQTCLG